MSGFETKPKAPGMSGFETKPKAPGMQGGRDETQGLRAGDVGEPHAAVQALTWISIHCDRDGNDRR
jgi:hypothetical protein